MASTVPTTALVRRPEEADERDQEQARIEPVRAVELDERAAFCVVPVPQHLGPNLLTRGAPAVERTFAPELLDGLHRPVEGDPRHDLRMSEVPTRPAHLPDPFVRLVPAGLEPLEQLASERPRVVGRVEPTATCLVEGVDDLSVDVELSLAGGAVPDPDRA